jgi:hypothetical protein
LINSESDMHATAHPSNEQMHDYGKSPSSHLSGSWSTIKCSCHFDVLWKHTMAAGMSCGLKVSPILLKIMTLLLGLHVATVVSFALFRSSRTVAKPEVSLLPSRLTKWTSNIPFNNTRDTRNGGFWNTAS